jgi:hypothetical protein
MSDVSSRSAASKAAAAAILVERVRQVALEKHIRHVQAEAQKEIASREVEQKYFKECEGLESSASNDRRAFYIEHQKELKRQMQEQEEKRRVDRESSIAGASHHNFPDFHEGPSSDVQQCIREVKWKLKEDLDDQVRHKLNKKNLLKQEDREIALKEAELNKVESQRDILKDAHKKERERTMLVAAWDRSIRLKKAQKAIDTLDMRSAGAEGLSDLSHLKASLGDKVPRVALDGISNNSSRPPTGSARRAPLGAAASLALRRGAMSARK